MEGPTKILLLTNDDGLDAPGLAALRRAADGLGKIHVIAPSGPRSGCGHAVTTHAPIRIDPRDAEAAEIAVDGTPADCVRLGLHHLASDTSLVLAGINSGGNRGADVFHSGTVAAVREAVLHERPGIAVSQYVARGRAIDWDQSARWAQRVLELLCERSWEPGTFWNVNLPHPPPGASEPAIVFCPVDPSPLPLRFRVEGEFAHYSGNYQARPRRSASDVEVCFGGAIAVSLVRLLG